MQLLPDESNSGGCCNRGITPSSHGQTTQNLENMWKNPYKLVNRFWFDQTCHIGHLCTYMIYCIAARTLVIGTASFVVASYSKPSMTPELPFYLNMALSQPVELLSSWEELHIPQKRSWKLSISKTFNFYLNRKESRVKNCSSLN